MKDTNNTETVNVKLTVIKKGVKPGKTQDEYFKLLKMLSNNGYEISESNYTTEKGM